MRVLLLVLAFATALISGCDIVGTDVELKLLLPETPEYWYDSWGDCSYLLSWRIDALTSGEAQIPAGSDITVSVPKGFRVVFVAVPYWNSGPAVAAGETMAPAGAVWHPSAAEQVVNLRYRDGPVASVLTRAARVGADIQTFNLDRLHDEMSLRIAGDPWNMDLDRLVRALCEHSMRQSYVRPVELIQALVEFPPGSWLSFSPFAPGFSSGMHTVALGVGLTPFYDSNGRRFLVDVDHDGNLWWTLTTTGRQS